MVRPTDRPARHSGYTLIELLMVIAIISILAALLISAVNRVRGVAKTTTATADITQLDTVLTKFKQDFNVLPASHMLASVAAANGVVPVPRRFRMPFRINDPTTGSPEPEFQFLKRMFPRWNPPIVLGSPNSDLDLTKMNTPGDPNYHPEYVALVQLTNPAYSGPGPINAGLPSPPQGLDPNQAMVLQLGGPMALLQNTTYVQGNAAFQPLGLGWVTDAPYAPAQTASAKKGPFFDFPADRLVPTADVATASPPIVANKLNQFVDPWGTAYAFFSASAGDAYDPRVMFPWTADPTSQIDPILLGYNPENDPNKQNAATNPKGTFTIHPFRSASKWHNAGKFQIISAGPNKVFGPGGAIVDTATATSQPPNGAGLQLPSAGGKLLYAYTPPGGPANQYYTILWEPSQVGQHPYYQEKSRGEDDLCNFNAGANLGTSVGP